jgi:hypothetical protein
MSRRGIDTVTVALALELDDNLTHGIELRACRASDLAGMRALSRQHVDEVSA